MVLSATCLWARVEDLRPWLRYAASDVAHDTILAEMAERVTDEVERETDRIYVARSLIETLRGSGTPSLRLRGYPVTALTSVTRDGADVEATTYRLDAEQGVLWHVTDVWARADPPYVVTYTAGYARAAVPPLVLQVATQLLRARYLAWASSRDVYRSGDLQVDPLAPDWISIRRQLDTLRYAVRVPGH